METDRRAVFGIQFGYLAEPISEQLRAQGMWADALVCLEWEKDAHSIARLNHRGLLPDSQRDKAERRLVQKITKGVTKRGATSGD
jgi:hypothetical protein